MTTYSPLASPSATRAVLERHGHNPKKMLGQNFLINDAVIGKILTLSGVGASEENTQASRDENNASCRQSATSSKVRPGVLEVGPGIGTLTLGLLRAGAQVVAIERDFELPRVLEETLAGYESDFTLVQKDALDVTVEDILPLGDNFQLVANLPYAVAATIVLDYFQNFKGMQSATVMVQREVADRMAARPGTKNYGAYTVKLALYAQVQDSFLVGPGNFMPAPHVDSAVIRLNRRAPTDKLYKVLNAEGEGSATTDISASHADLLSAAATMADAAFASRRKTIANSCKTYFGGREPQITQHLPQIFEAAGIDPKIRGEVLEPAQFIRLGQAYLSHK